MSKEIFRQTAPFDRTLLGQYTSLPKRFGFTEPTTLISLADEAAKSAKSYEEHGDRSSSMLAASCCWALAPFEAGYYIEN